MATAYIKDKKVVEENWGKEFVELLADPKIHFTMDAIFVDVQTPVEVIGNEKTESVTTVRIEEPNVSQLKSVDTVKGDMAKAAVLLESSVGITAASLDRMKSRDFMRCQKVMACFLGGGQETGKK